MLHWLYNLVTPAPTPRFVVGDIVIGISMAEPGIITALRLQQVRGGLRWNEETRGWVYQVGGTWHGEDFFETAIVSHPPDLSDAELAQVRAEIRAHFGERSAP